MSYLKVTILFLIIFISTVVTYSEVQEIKESEFKKEIATKPFPKHPGTVKMINMLDKSVELISIDEIPKWNQFAYYYKDGIRIVHINDIDKAVKAIPIVEERMYSRGEGKKLVPPKEADYLLIEKYGPDGTLLITNTLWRDGVRGERKQK